MYGRINPENRAFEWAPVSFITPDGTTVMNFCFDEELMVQYGFKPVEEEPEPGVGPNQFAVPRYEDKGEYIQQTWEVIEEDVE